MKLLTAFGLAALLASVLAASACGGSSTAPTINAPTVTDTFTGTIDSGGSVTHTFVLTKSGEIDIKVNSETVTVNGTATAVTIPLTMDLGVWNGSSCGAAYYYPSVATGFVTTQLAAVTATYCIRVYDLGTGSGGSITPGSPVTYSVSVAHP